ncbi:MAG: hypothetical protein HRT89_14510 [Lentisphaeria bacterium]|nr:hypothetical protein [Lentisphaeria bacterium]NQZ69270.1 hypothetical protein [Lentisphaeria bacterium]
MKKYILGLILVSLAPLFGQDKDGGISFEAGVDHVTKYVWRGAPVNITGSSVQPSLDASTVSDGMTMGLNVWASAATSRANSSRGDSYGLEEVDYTAYLSTELDNKMTFDAGVIIYDFPTLGDADTMEIFAGLSKDVEMGLPLNVGMTIYYDLDAADGFYISTSASYEKELDKTFTLGVDVSFGFGDADYNLWYWGTDESDFNDLSVSVGISAPLGENASFGLSWSYSEMIGSDIEDNVGEIENDWMTWSFSYSF